MKFSDDRELYIEYLCNEFSISRFTAARELIAAGWRLSTAYRELHRQM